MIRDRAKTGIEGLDEMLEGGLLTGRPYVVSGTSGTGKSTMALHFLVEGAVNGERVLYVAIDEPPNEVLLNFRKMGWELDGIGVLDGTPDVLNYDKTPVRDVSSERKIVPLSSVGESIRRTSEKGPTDVTVNTLQELIKQEFKERKYTRIVIDSLTSLKHFYIRTSEEFATLQSFFRTLSDLGATSMLTVQIPDIARPGIESQLARGEIRLHKWFDGRGLMRGVTIEKYRGSSHDSVMRHLKITQHGIVVPKSNRDKRKKSPAPNKEPEEKPPAAEKEEPLPPPPENGMKDVPPPGASKHMAPSSGSGGPGGPPI
ncbi:MAG: AAA family ATPase [Thermoplasmata archaeon]|nr:AAA family ATPase [Thermoplasmata archaeon]